MQTIKKLYRFPLLIIGLFTLSSFGQNQTENWQSYIASYDENKPGSTTVRMDIFNQTPMPEYNYVLVTGLTYKSDREDGFPQDETFKLLHKFGDELIKLLNDNVENISVGTFMYNFQRLEYFYIKSDKGIENKLKKFYEINYPDNESYINLKVDKDWGYYRDFLYPSEDIKGYLEDQKVVEALRNAGDNLTKSRQVNHWAYFKSELEMKSFKTEIQKIGFKIQAFGKIEHDSTPFEIQFWKTDKVDLDSINPITSSLRELANKYNGSYDGWETSVEKE
jgi:uncharacterized protein (TIGR01619 family)